MKSAGFDGIGYKSYKCDESQNKCFKKRTDKCNSFIEKPQEWTYTALVMYGYDDMHQEYLEDGGNLDFHQWLLSQHNITVKE